MDNAIIKKIGNAEFTLEMLARYYSEGRYIISGSKIYRICYNQKKDAYIGKAIYKADGSMTRRGRFYAMTESDTAHLLDISVNKLQNLKPI